MSMKKVFEVAMLLTAKDEATRKILDATKKQEMAMKNMSGYANKSFGIGAGAGAVGVGISAGLGVAVKAAEESEIAFKRLDHTFKTMGETDSKAATQAADYASKLQMRIGVEDEEIEMVQSKIATFRKVSDETARMSGIFDRATEAAFDLAAGGFGEASENAVQLGKALQNPALGAAALARTGALNKADIPLIKMIQATRGLGAAQEYVLKAVEKQVQGQAANTATAASKMRVKWAEVSETLGKVLLPQFIKLMASIGKIADKFQNWASKNPELLSTIIKLAVGIATFSFAVSGTAFVLGGVFKIIQAVIFISKTYTALTYVMRAGQMAYTFSLLAGSTAGATFTAVVTAMNLAFLASPIFWVIAGIVALGAAVYLVYKNWGKIKEWFIGLWESVKNTFKKFLVFVKEWGWLMAGPVGWIIKFWSKLPEWFSKLGGMIWNGLTEGMKSKVAGVYNFIKKVGKGIADAFKSVLGIASPSKVFMDYGVNITEGASKGMEKGQSKLNDTSTGMGKNIIPSGSGRSSSGGGGITVNFAPVINGGSGDIASQVKALIPELIRQIEAKMQRKQALSY